MSYKEYDPKQFPQDQADRQQEFGTLPALTAPSMDTEAMLAERTRLLSLSATVATALAGSDSLQAILQRCAEALAQHLNVAAACLWTLGAGEKRLALRARAGIHIPVGDLDGAVRVGDATIGGIARQRQAFVSNRVTDDIGLPDGTWLERAGIRAFAGYPLIVEDRLVGVMAMFAKQPFSAGTLKTLMWMAGVIAMGIDRLCISDALARSIAKVVRMNKSLRRKNAQLDEFAYRASHDL